MGISDSSKRTSEGATEGVDAGTNGGLQASNSLAKSSSLAVTRPINCCKPGKSVAG